MLVRAPLMEAEQHGSIRIEDLTKVVMVGRRLGLAEERLVPFEAARNVACADDRPGAFHRISALGLTLEIGCKAPSRPGFVSFMRPPGMSKKRSSPSP